MITSFLYVLYIYICIWNCVYMFPLHLEIPQMSRGLWAKRLWFVGTVGSCVFSSGPAQKVFWQNAPFVLHVCVCTPFLHRAWCLVSFVQTTFGLAWTHAYHIQPGPARLGQGKHQRTLWSVPVHLGWKLLIKLFYYCVLQQRFGFLLSSTWQSQSGTSVAFQNQSE